LKLVALGLEVLVNVTVSGAQPELAEAMNPAVGAVVTVTVCVLVVVPQAFEAESVTV
jgi:hypothetical protein